MRYHFIIFSDSISFQTVGRDMKDSHGKYLLGGSLKVVWTNSMVHNSAWEADSRSACQEISCFSWSLEFHYCVHKTATGL